MFAVVLAIQIISLEAKDTILEVVPGIITIESLIVTAAVDDLRIMFGLLRLQLTDEHAEISTDDYGTQIAIGTKFFLTLASHQTKNQCCKAMKANGAYTDWSKWSPCSRECGKSARKREQYCQEISCMEKSFNSMEQICYRSCQTNANCNRTTAKRLWTSGGRSKPTEPFLGSVAYTCTFYPPLVYKSGPRPYTIYDLFVKSRNVASINVRYQAVNVPDTWFNYPTNSQPPGDLWLDLSGLYYIATYITSTKLAEPLEGTAFEVTVGKYVSSYVESTCFQVDLFGCHIPLPHKITFSLPLYTRWLENPELPVIDSFVCTTNARPYYYEHLHIISKHNDKLISNDESQTLYSKITAKNKHDHAGQHAITLFANFTSAKELEKEFLFWTNNGIVYYFGVFDCLGEVTVIDGIEYGNFDKGATEVFFVYDLNECLNYTKCSNMASCVNVVGSFYCMCLSPYYGDGYDCYTKSQWFDGQLGVFSTRDFQEYDVPDIYYRGLFYAHATDMLFACGVYEKGSPYGCSTSQTSNVVWKATHPRLDVIFGQSSLTGNVYGYSTKDKSYLMYEPATAQWYSIPEVTYRRASQTGLFVEDKVVVLASNAHVNEERDELFHPLLQAYLHAGQYTFAVTLEGVSQLVDSVKGVWVPVFFWKNLPVKD